MKEKESFLFNILPNQGIGRLCFAALEEGISSLRTGSSDANKAMYHSLGFTLSLDSLLAWQQVAMKFTS